MRRICVKTDSRLTNLGLFYYLKMVAYSCNFFLFFDYFFFYDVFSKYSPVYLFSNKGALVVRGTYLFISGTFKNNQLLIQADVLL